MLRPTGQQPVGRQGLAPPSGPTAATSSGSASTSLSALPFTSGSGHAGSRSYPPLPQDTATTLSLDPASLVSSGCPYKQAIDSASTGIIDMSNKERDPWAVLLVASVCAALLLGLRGTLRLRVRKRACVLLVAAAFAVPKWRKALLLLVDQIAGFA